MADETTADPRNEALAAEHAAVWTYAVLAARTGAQEQRPLLRLLERHHTAHVVARDALLGAIADDGAVPAVTLASYPLPARLDTAAAVRAVAVDVEAACNVAAAWVIAQLAGVERKPFVDSLVAGATRSLALGADPETFPGAADLAPGSTPGSAVADA